MNNNIVNLNDLENNPTPRVPVCLCLDTSGSMGRIVRGETQSTGRTIYKDGQTWNIVTGGVSAIDDLNEGINQFFEAIRTDEVAVYSAEICVITFGGKKQNLSRVLQQWISKILRSPLWQMVTPIWAKQSIWLWIVLKNVNRPTRTRVSTIFSRGLLS